LTRGGKILKVPDQLYKEVQNKNSRDKGRGQEPEPLHKKRKNHRTSGVEKSLSVTREKHEKGVSKTGQEVGFTL